MRWKEMPLEGWGRAHTARVEAARPERLSELTQALTQAASRNGVAAYGAGRSYGDNALNDGGNAILTQRLDRILAFDEATGRIEVEPGVTFRRLMDVFLPRGWLAPVTPGTSFATIGGAVANDIHGKNHEHDGTFGQHVTALDVVLPSGETVTIGPDQHPEWFRATVGGVGLTGVISRIAFTMRRVESPCVRMREQPIADLDAYLAAFEAAKDAPWSVGWIDALASGKDIGRGILETAEPWPHGDAEPPRKARGIPFDFPGFALNPLSVSAFNTLYRRRVPAGGRETIRGYDAFFYPLDAVLRWNRIYGKRGFYQFQCVVPFADGRQSLLRLLEEIAKSRGASFLAVLKRMGPGRGGYLSFPMEGYTLALDFPRKPGTESLFHRLEQITLDCGGRIYLAKDALLSARSFAGMYPELGQFRSVLREMDPGGRMQTAMSRRLNIRGDA